MNAVDRVADLQRRAGNRAVSSLLARSALALQRAPKAPGSTKATAGPGAAGQLELPGLGSLPIESASWGVEQKPVIDQVGRNGVPDVQPGAKSFKAVKVTRVADDKSDDIARMFEKVVIDQAAEGIGNVELHLTRPSAGGAVPAASIGLRDAIFTSYGRAKDGEPAMETLSLAYDDAEVEGAVGGKAPAVKNAAAHVSVLAGNKTWDPVPALTFDVEKRDEVMVPGVPVKPAPQPRRLSFTAPLGPVAGQFSDALTSTLRLSEVTLTPKDLAAVTLGEVLVTGIDITSSGGTSTIEVKLIGAQSR